MALPTHPSRGSLTVKSLVCDRLRSSSAKQVSWQASGGYAEAALPIGCFVSSILLFVYQKVLSLKHSFSWGQCFNIAEAFPWPLLNPHFLCSRDHGIKGKCKRLDIWSPWVYRKNVTVGRVLASVTDSGSLRIGRWSFKDLCHHSLKKNYFRRLSPLQLWILHHNLVSVKWWPLVWGSNWTWVSK